MNTTYHIIFIIGNYDKKQFISKILRLPTLRITIVDRFSPELEQLGTKKPIWDAIFFDSSVLEIPKGFSILKQVRCQAGEVPIIIVTNFLSRLNVHGCSTNNYCNSNRFVGAILSMFQKNKKETSLAANEKIIHGLNNKLTTIICNAKFLAIDVQKINLKKSAEKIIKVTQKAAKQLNKLIIALTNS
jgi:hypothetical protein